MNKNSNKTMDFLKKEGFYVILFVCLCVVATVAAITTRNPKKVAVKPPVANSEQIKIKSNDKKTVKENSNKPKDSLQVNKNINDLKHKNLPSVPKKNILNVAKNNNDKVTSVSKTHMVEYIKPIESGVLDRAYDQNVKERKSLTTANSTTYKNNLGIYIGAKLGTSVLAVSDGKVKDVNRSENGICVEISDANGVTSRYCNLEKEIAVKKGDTVNMGDKIGKLGNTATNFSTEDYRTKKYDSHLYLQMFKDGKNIDPATYVIYKMPKNN